VSNKLYFKNYALEVSMTCDKPIMFCNTCESDLGTVDNLFEAIERVKDHGCGKVADKEAKR
jgi:hypothetical protein